MKHYKTRKLNVKAKILLVASVILLAVVLLVGVNAYLNMRDAMVEQGVAQAQVAARLAVSAIDAGSLRGLAPGDEGTEAYQTAITALRKTKEACGVKYLFTLTRAGSRLFYVIDTDESEGQAAIGDGFEDYTYEELRSVFEGEEFVQNFIDHSDYGEVITAYLPLFDSEGNVIGVLGSDYDASGIRRQLSGVRLRIIQLTAAGLVVAWLIMNFLIGRIVKHLMEVNEKVYELVNSEGDLTKTLDVDSGDEMELIAGNVNALLAYMREIMLRVSGSSAELNGSTKAVAEKVAVARENITDVSATMEEMSAAMEETTASINQINDSIDEIYGNIGSISERAESGSASTGAIRKKAQEIYQRAAQEQKTALSKTREMADALEEKIERSKSVTEIELLTKNILEITDQTNLLALNASIEAARAGEAGSGFAVVASEIGKLAADSATAAEKIGKVSGEVIAAVEGLAEEAGRMVSFVEETVMQGYRQLLSTSEDYSSDAADINGLMERFAEESEQLSRGMDGIRESVAAVNIAAEESAKGVVSVAETAGELTTAVGQIEQEAQNNRQVAETLSAEVGKFKLE